MGCRRGPEGGWCRTCSLPLSPCQPAPLPRSLFRAEGRHLGCIWTSRRHRILPAPTQGILGEKVRLRALQACGVEDTVPPGAPHSVRVCPGSPLTSVSPCVLWGWCQPCPPHGNYSCKGVGGVGLRGAFTQEAGAAHARGAIMACAADQQGIRGNQAGCTVLLGHLCSGGPATDTGGGVGVPLPPQWEPALSLVHQPCAGPGCGD